MKYHDMKFLLFGYVTLFVEKASIYRLVVLFKKIIFFSVRNYMICGKVLPVDQTKVNPVIIAVLFFHVRVYLSYRCHQCWYNMIC